MKIGVSLLSGGLDSTVATAIAKGECDQLIALSVDYDQRHKRELDHAQRVAQALNIDHQEIVLPSMSATSWYSALTDLPDDALDHDRDPEVMASSPPPLSYVPMRNTVFLSMAAGLLESLALDQIENQNKYVWNVQTSIYIGANALDYSGYPDCRPAYFTAIQDALNMGSKLFTAYHGDIKLETPIIDLSKADIIRKGLEIGVPLELTWSCYMGLEYPCGSCDSCILRSNAFSEVGIPDPAL